MEQGVEEKDERGEGGGGGGGREEEGMETLAPVSQVPPRQQSASTGKSLSSLETLSS